MTSCQTTQVIPVEARVKNTCVAPTKVTTCKRKPVKDSDINRANLVACLLDMRRYIKQLESYATCLEALYD